MPNDFHTFAIYAKWRSGKPSKLVYLTRAGEVYSRRGDWPGMQFKRETYTFRVTRKEVNGIHAGLRRGGYVLVFTDAEFTGSIR